MTQRGVQTQEPLGDDERWWLGSDGGQSGLVAALVKITRLGNTALAGLFLNFVRFGIFNLVEVNKISQMQKQNIKNKITLLKEKCIK